MRQLGEHDRDLSLQARHITLGGPGAELTRAEQPGHRVRMIALGAFQRGRPALDAFRGNAVSVFQDTQRRLELLFQLRRRQSATSSCACRVRDRMARTGSRCITSAARGTTRRRREYHEQNRGERVAIDDGGDRTRRDGQCSV